MKERKDRADDALHATRAAVEEGIVPGGGTTFIRAIAALDDVRSRGEERYGVEIVRKALIAPLDQIATNCGLDGKEIVTEVRNKKGREGYDAKNGEYTSMVKAGIIDPAKVTITAIESAASIAGLNLTTDVLITDVPDKSEPAAGAQT